MNGRVIDTKSANGNDPNFHLIDAAYDAAVEPEAYDRFMAAWGAYVDGALGRSPDATSGELAFDAALASHFERASRIGEGLRKARALQPTPGSITAQDRRISLVLPTVPYWQ